MKKIIPPKLSQGSEIRIIAPSRSGSIISQENILLAQKKLENMGYTVSFSRNFYEKDILLSSSIQSRLDDLHDAFRDPQVSAILTVIGGFNSSTLLDYLDYELIQNNPKILCGYSDITALQNAIFAKTGLVTYSGPHFSTFSMQQGFEYIAEYFTKCLTDNIPFTIDPSPTRSEDQRYKDQQNRVFVDNTGYKVLRSWTGEGTIVGGNLCTLNLLQGTSYMPSLKDAILFIEDDDQAGDLFAEEFDRNFQSLVHQKDFRELKGLVIGRFQVATTNMTHEKLVYIVEQKLKDMSFPVLSDVDFGHTYPMCTFPIGWVAKLDLQGDKVVLQIVEH